MELAFGNLAWEVDVCRREILTSAWRTENFALKCRIVPFCRIYLPLSGEGWVEHGGVNYHIRPGHYYLIPPFVTSRVQCQERLEIYWLNFNVFIEGSTLDIFSVIKTQYQLAVADLGFFEKLFDQIEPHYRMGIRAGIKVSPGGELAGKAALMLLVRPFLDTVDAFDGPVSDRSRFFTLIRYIEENLSHNFSLKELAGQFHLSPTYLTNLFTRNMGISLIRYCNVRKLNHALRLLIESKFSVSEIADALGFEDVNNFSRLFKRYHGISPRNFRGSQVDGIISQLMLEKQRKSSERIKNRRK